MHLHIVSREQAKSSGLKRYFLGEPCVRGQLAQRMVSTGACLCVECKAFYAANAKAVRLANPEADSERRRKARQAKPEQYRQRQREKYARTREKVLQKAKERYWADPAAASAKSKKHWAENRDEIGAKRRAQYAADGHAQRQSAIQYYAGNKARIAERRKSYYEANRDLFRAHGSKYRAVRRERMPCWFGELDEFVARECFSLADDREAATGIEWHVDHVIPLRARKASGLHCAANLQVIPEVLNLTKHNRMVMAEPDEWLRWL